MRYHISKHGEPAVCNAKQGNCPLGETEHFDTIESAQEYADKVNQDKHGLLPEMNNKINSSWENKFLSCKSFDELAEQHAEDIVKEQLFEGDIFNETKKTWRELHYKNSVKDLQEISQQEAIDIIRKNVNKRDLHGWFREFDSDYKPNIENYLITNDKIRNASLNIAHIVYKETTNKNISFEDFINSKIEVYRGGNFDYIENDVFVSYSFSKSIAKKFSKNNEPISSRKVKIKDTLGSLQTTGEAELMVPRNIDESTQSI